MSSTDTPKKILLKAGSGGNVLRKEANAGEAGIVPGMLLDKNGSGEVIKHATVDGFVMPLVAEVQDFLGKRISDTYADGDLVQYDVAQRGEERYMFLAAGEDVNQDDYLESHGDGYLAGYTGTGTRIARALEDKDNSAGVTATRIKVEIV
jgi:hypothetical protein